MGGRDNQKQAQVEGSQQNNKSIVLQLHEIARAGIEIALKYGRDMRAARWAQTGAAECTKIDRLCNRPVGETLPLVLVPVHVLRSQRIQHSLWWL
jgi:hypothetical protein